MEVVFIVGRLRANDNWDYFKEKQSTNQDGSPLFDNYQDNHFVGVTPEQAKRFGTYVECVALIDGLGPGYFKIDKLFIKSDI